MRTLSGWFPLYEVADADSNPDLEGALLFEPRSDYDVALIGYTKLVGGETVAVYCYDLLAEVIRGKLGPDEADDVNAHLCVNMAGTYGGIRTPMIVCQHPVDEDAEDPEDLVLNLWGREVAR